MKRCLQILVLVTLSGALTSCGFPGRPMQAMRRGFYKVMHGSHHPGAYY